MSKEKKHQPKISLLVWETLAFLEVVRNLFNFMLLLDNHDVISIKTYELDTPEGVSKEIFYFLIIDLQLDN